LLLKLSEPPQRAITKRAVIAAILLLLGVATVGHDDSDDDRPTGRTTSPSEFPNGTAYSTGHTWQSAPLSATQRNQRPEPELLGRDQEKGQTQGVFSSLFHPNFFCILAYYFVKWN
jgi:hypothetical protein